jgi:hypothetical protein
MLLVINSRLYVTSPNHSCIRSLYLYSSCQSFNPVNPDSDNEPCAQTHPVRCKATGHPSPEGKIQTAAARAAGAAHQTACHGEVVLLPAYFRLQVPNVASVRGDRTPVPIYREGGRGGKNIKA